MIFKQNQSPLELLCSFAVESANGKFVRIERTEDRATLVVFTGRVSRTELKLPIQDLTYDAIKKIIAEAETPVEVAVIA